MSRPLLLPRAPASVTNARRSLCADLEAAGIDDSTVSDAILVLSELLSNALRHAAPLPDPFPPDSVQVLWVVRAGDGVIGGTECIEIAICDGGGSTLPTVARPSVSALGGRGLGIVERVAARWGTEVDDRTTTVWAVLPFAPAAPDPESGAPEPGSVSSEDGHHEDRERGGGPRVDSREARRNRVSPDRGFLTAGS